MKKKLIKTYKKFRHSVRLALESNETIDELYIKNKNREFLKNYDGLVNDKKIVLINYMGRGYGCNCKYLANEIIRQQLDYELVWLVNENEDKDAFPSKINLVDYKSSKALEELATAKFIISNYHLNYFIKKGFSKKEEQVYIQLWHGSLGIKKIERHVPGLTESKMWVMVSKYNCDMTNYWISNSDFETEVYKSAFWNVRDIRQLGHPRNDIFFGDNTLLSSKVLSKIGVDSSKKIALYMPTFREDYRLDCYNIDVDRLCKKLEEKFGGEWVVLVRLHSRILQLRDKFINEFGADKLVDVTNYDDVQELIAIADVMISDYSSAIFDFLLTKKPGFIYATDIDEYSNERGMYYSIYDTPFSVAKNNDELCSVIENFNEEEYIVKVNRFLEEKGCIEDGNASANIIDFINSIAYNIKSDK